MLKDKFKKFLKRINFIKNNKDIKILVDYFKDVNEKKTEAGAAIFYPEPDDEYLYRIMLRRGIIKRSPTGKGYMTTESFERIWGGDVAMKILAKSKEK